jgi:7,8-dihydropterin-6-yl-methyl-4-(beta-D-ribofuranosyl)aminobenzene 5'-phosphate synthase
MEFKITTLVDNSVSLGGSGLIAEHGLAFLIESQDHTVLFDTGQHMALSHNADKLNIDLSRIEAVVLSHGHYDHTGGLKHMLEKNAAFRLYAHPDVFAIKLKSKKKDKYKKIGIPIKRAVFESTDVQLVLTQNTCEIVPGISTSGEIPLENDFESIESDFFVERQGRITLNRVVELTGKQKIHAIIGGLHLGKASDAKLKMIIDHLAGFGLEKIGVSHCTGTNAMLALFNTFKDKVFVNTVGSVISF